MLTEPLVAAGRQVSLSKMEGDALSYWTKLQVLCATAKFEAIYVDPPEHAPNTLALLVVAGWQLVRVACPDAPVEWLDGLDEPDKARIIDAQDSLNRFPDVIEAFIPQVNQLLVHSNMR